MAYRLEWDGDDIRARTDRAIGRTVISIGERIAALYKELVHVQSGTLRRSIHTAIPGDYHNDDQAQAHGVQVEPSRRTPGVYVSGIPGTNRGVDLADERNHLLTWERTLAGHPHKAVVEVGSWIDYACVEETGRHHYALHPAYEMIAPTGWETLHEAFRQEGLA